MAGAIAVPVHLPHFLRRQFDQSVANQRAAVYVDGQYVGDWRHAGGNPHHAWRCDDLPIPARYTAGKSSLQIQIKFLSSDKDWNEFAYSIYTLKGGK